MRIARIVFLLASAVLATSAAAHGGARVSIGFTFGPGFFYSPWYGPYPYAYPAPYPAPYAAAVVRREPQVFIERAAEPASEPPQWWYYCAEAKAYYPYVKYCAAGWQ